MTTTPDPATVRELARKFLLDDGLTADELGYVVYSHTGYGVGHEEFQAWRDAIGADVQEATVTKVASWPDEQPQDERDATVPDNLYWSFTGGMDTCFSEHDGEYLECCWRAGLAYVLKLHEQQVRATAQDERDKESSVEDGDLVPAWKHFAMDPEQPQDGVAPYRPLPDDEEFIDILQGGSFYAEVTAFRRLAATIGVEQTYRKWTKLQRRARTANGRPLDEQPQAEQPQDDGDVRAVAPCCGGPHAGWIHTAECAGLEARDAKTAARERIAELAEHAEEER